MIIGNQMSIRMHGVLKAEWKWDRETLKRLGNGIWLKIVEIK